MKQQDALLCRTCRSAVVVSAQGDAVCTDRVTAKGHAVLPKNLEHLWNDTGKRRPKCSQRNPPHCHFVLRKSHTGMAGIKLGSLK